MVISVPILFKNRLIFSMLLVLLPFTLELAVAPCIELCQLEHIALVCVCLCNDSWLMHVIT